MNTKDISHYSREELQDILRVLKTYKQSHRQIGARARIYDPKNPPEPELRVEYASGISQSLLEKILQSAIALHFPDIKDQSNVVYTENTHLTGGIRIFYGDDMVDISFQRFVNMIHNSTI